MTTIVDLVRAARSHQLAGRLAEAGRLFDEVQRLAPDDLTYLIGYADFLRAAGRIEEAVAGFRRVIGLAPQTVPLYDNLAMIFLSNGRYAEAEAVLRQGVAANPDSLSLQRNLGSFLSDSGRPQEGFPLLEHAVAAEPSDAALREIFGKLLLRMRRHADAELQFREALRLRPGDPAILNSIGATLRHQSKLGAAEDLYRQALADFPDDPDLNGNLAGVLRHQGRIAEATGYYKRALSLRSPWPEVHSNYIFSLDFDISAGPAEMAEARRSWQVSIEAPLLQAAVPLQRDRDPDRTVLRIGYVSADFNWHSASDGFGSVLLNHDRQAFHVTLYSSSDVEDHRTEAFAAHADRFRRVRLMTDAELAAQIREDEIDLLVDLSGHSAGNRLPVFARRPAPVQATGWGYATGTGLMSMDYLLADRWLVPADLAEFYTEQVVELPCVLSFRPPEILPEVSSLPCLRKGYVTFGNFNRLEKASDSCLAAWAAILRAVPESRLLLKCTSLDDAAIRRRIAERFTAEGIAGDRLVLQGRSSRLDQLRLHAEVDLALDSFRHCGGVTTCEALSMGVPVVTLCGDVPVARNGASILAGLGCPEWIAWSVDEYVGIACAMAGDPGRLQSIRQGLRSLLMASPLGDNRGYTRQVEAAYRRMWVRYCMGLRGAGCGRG